MYFTINKYFFAKSVLISKMQKLDEIHPNLFLGGLDELEYIKDYNITHVLSVLSEPEIPKDIDKSIKHKIILAHDDNCQNMFPVFEESYEFIDSALSKENGKIFVHCAMGISRSVTVVAAYLMKKLEIDRSQALKIIRDVRPKAGPRTYFFKQLYIYEFL
jgi:protein-tyrosine phosphatase